MSSLNKSFGSQNFEVPFKMHSQKCIAQLVIQKNSNIQANLKDDSLLTETRKKIEEIKTFIASESHASLQVKLCICF